MNSIARVGLALAISVLALCALFTIELVTPSRLNAPGATTTIVRPVDAPPPPRAAGADPGTQTEDADGAADFYGNEVTPAVAKYSFDALGSLYELHSPQTELPRLGSPKS